MKHIKKFNEELDFSTYLNASHKLKKLGHKDRASALTDWAIKQEWVRVREQYLPFGKFKINLHNKETNKTITDYFELVIQFDNMSFEDSFEYSIEAGETEFTMCFFIGLIPDKKETIDKCDKLIDDFEMDNGFHWGGIALFDMELKDLRLKITKFYIENYNYSDFSFADRSSANNFKNIIIKLFSDPTFNYPFNDYNYLESELLVSNSLSVDYGFKLEDVADFMKTISPNTLYKTL